MIYRLRLWKSILYPKRSFFQLQKAESIYGLRPRIFSLFLISALLFFLTGISGIGSHVFSSEVLSNSGAAFEWLKGYFSGGRFILGLFYAALIIFFQALWFWTLTDVPYSKLVVLQAFVFPVLLFEQAINILLAVQFDLPWFSSPFSLGPAAHYVTDNRYFIYFLGCISLFKFWVIAIQLYGLRLLSSRRPSASFFIVLGVHLIFWLGASFLAFLDFKKIL